MKIEKTKILFIGPYPPPYSGPEMAMKTLLESELSISYEIRFLKTNVRSSNEHKGKIDLHIVIAFFSFVIRLIGALLDHRPTLVYYFVTATGLGWLGRDVWCIFISRLFGAKVIIHMRAGHFRYNYDQLDTLQKKVIKAACSLVSLAFVQADCLRNQFKGLISENRIATVYNAIDVSHHQNQNPFKYSPCTVLFLGLLTYAKGYCDILKIIPAIAEKYPDVRFCFAGTKIKGERNVFHNQVNGRPIHFEDPDACYDIFVKGKYDRNYEYLGIISGKEKVDRIKNCTVFVLPSYSEGFSMAILEALTLGKPLVCTPVGALGEIIKDEINGLLVAPGDLEGLEQAIERLLGDSDLRNRMALTNLAYGQASFSKEIIAARIAYYFDSVINDLKH
jgi:glycosyltransferase involved in cell wall biosynthesis